jgi:hypothetical protein
MVHDRLVQHQCCNDGQLWAEITAAALRKPEIGLACLNSRNRRPSDPSLRRHDRLLLTEAQARFSAHATFIVMLVKSAMMARQGHRAQ